jgi:phage terminase Nu1 subunit (DNA packaging protein)
MSSPGVVMGNKKQLAKALGVTAPTLDRWLERFGDAVPVLQRGSNGKPFKFDITAVVGFFRQRQADEAGRAIERDEQLAQLALPGLAPDGPAGPATQREIGLSLDNEGKRQKLMKERGELTLASEVRSGLTAALSALGDRLDASVRKVASEHHLPPQVTAALETAFAASRTDIVRTLKQFLREPDAADQPS